MNLEDYWFISYLIISIFVSGTTGEMKSKEILHKATALDDLNSELAAANIELSFQKEQLRVGNERLESLLRISQHSTDNIQELLDFALVEAINLTNSKIGYIYFFDDIKQKII